jgi:geranylgeranyl diphosphate synthase, type II
MSVQLAAFMEQYRPRLEQALLNRLPLSDKPGTEMFNSAVSYAMFPGGKRMRPLFTLLAASALGGNPDQALPIACSIEYFHACSLIFDDLPAMDNAVERRGKRPTHQVFGEDVAMLVGLALFNQGYALLGQIDSWRKGRRLMAEMAACIGANGMIGGQVVDLRLGEKENVRLRPVSYLKTTSLMRLMLTAGAIGADADDGRVEAMAAFGENLGEAYQMLDDIVDEAEDHLPAPLIKKSVNVHALWRKANQKLQEARDGLLVALANEDPTLLIELADNIFSKQKKQATDRLTRKKSDWEGVSQSVQSLRTE